MMERDLLLGIFLKSLELIKMSTSQKNNIWENFTAYKKGVRRIGVTEKMAIGISTAEGYLPLPFTTHVQVLCEDTSAKPEHIAAHTFLFKSGISSLVPTWWLLH
jgi:hypothetical protein